jgi:hypothetical protein
LKQISKLVSKKKALFLKLFLKTSRSLVLSKDNKLGMMVNGEHVAVKDVFQTDSVKSFHDNKPILMKNSPISRYQVKNYFF